MNPVIIDANLLLLLIVGLTNRDYITGHKRLSGYSAADFDVLATAISLYSDIVLLPHVMAEVSNLVRQTVNPCRAEIQTLLASLVEVTSEIPVTSLQGVRQPPYESLGLTDAAILHRCTVSPGGIHFTLLTADRDLADVAHSLGCDVLDFEQLR